MNFSNVAQDAYYFEQLDLDDNNPKIVCFPPDPKMTRWGAENFLCNDLHSDVSGQVELSVNFKSMENQEIMWFSR